MKYNSPAKSLFVFLSCLFAAQALKAQDIIYKKDSSTVKAKVLEVNKHDIRYQLFDYPDGPLIVTSKSEVSAIAYQDGRREVFKRTQKTDNTIFGELGGNGGLYSLNYDHLFRLPNNLSIAARIGYSRIPAASGSGGITISKYHDFQTIPLSVSMLFGKAKMFELGIGYTPVIITESNILYDFRNYVAPSFGYRYQEESKHFFFRAGLVIGIEADRYPVSPVIAAPYLAWGFSF